MSVTVAPDTILPWGSVTDPLMEEVPVWANSGHTITTKTSTILASLRERIVVSFEDLNVCNLNFLKRRDLDWTENDLPSHEGLFETQG